jgi:hypothetical protein
MRILTLLACLVLAGCATTRTDANYSAYIEASARAQQQQAAQLASIADAESCNGDATCVVAAKALAAMAAQGAAQGAGVTQYVRQPGAAERVTLGLLGALPGLAQVYATIDAGRRNVDIARINADREIGMADAWAGVTADVAAAFGALPPTTYVGGNLISGTQHIGDTVGRDQIGGSQHIGDWRTGDDIRRDTAGRDQTDYGTGNRLWSAGPYDWTDVGNRGPRCAGLGCQQTNPPPPDPETGG